MPPDSSHTISLSTSSGATVKILTTVCFNLIVYILIGLPLAVLPGLVHFNLGYSAALAGLMVSLQYAATLITRSVIGRICDAKGPKTAVLLGLSCAVISGLCILAAAVCTGTLAILLWLALSRLWLGAAESGTGTGCITWGIGRAGAAHTAAVMSWNGVASYGGIALGAPLGVYLYHLGGLHALAIITIAAPLGGLALGNLVKATPVIPGIRMGFTKVLGQMLPYGMCLALGSVGFGTIVAFITLFYANHHWPNAAYALSAFGIAFVSVRIFLAGSIKRIGGFQTAIASFAVEFAGLLILWLATTPLTAMAGAVMTGLGFSLVFPAIAVEALKIIPLSNRGAAIGVYTVFLDLSLGITGPLAGLVIGHFGYPAVYLLAAISAAAAECLTLKLLANTRQKTSAPFA